MTLLIIGVLLGVWALLALVVVGLCVVSARTERAEQDNRARDREAAWRPVSDPARGIDAGV